jgi:ribosomal protein S5
VKAEGPAATARTNEAKKSRATWIDKLVKIRRCALRRQRRASVQLYGDGRRRQRQGKVGYGYAKATKFLRPSKRRLAMAAAAWLTSTSPARRFRTGRRALRFGPRHPVAGQSRYGVIAGASVSRRLRGRRYHDILSKSFGSTIRTTWSKQRSMP